MPFRLFDRLLRRPPHERRRAALIDADCTGRRARSLRGARLHRRGDLCRRLRRALRKLLDRPLRRQRSERRRASGGGLWETLIHPEDREARVALHERLLAGARDRGDLPGCRGRRRHPHHPRPCASGPPRGRWRARAGNHQRRHASRRGGCARGGGRRIGSSRSWTSWASTSTSPPSSPTARCVRSSRVRARTACSAGPSPTPRWRTGRRRSTRTTGRSTTGSTSG